MYDMFIAIHYFRALNGSSTSPTSLVVYDLLLTTLEN